MTNQIGIPTKAEDVEYRKSKMGVYPTRGDWRYQVVAPNGSECSGGGFATEADARSAGRRQARFQDRLERDRVDGIFDKRTDRVLERGVRACTKCGEIHDLVATTRRGRRSGQTWEKPGCGVYYQEPWESTVRRLQAAALEAS